MKWASRIATTPNLAEAVASVAAGVRGELAGQIPDLALLFVTGHFSRQFAQLPAMLHTQFPCKTLIGCSAGGVIGHGTEAENTAAVSLTAAVLPGVRITPIHTDTLDLPDEDDSPEKWRAWMGFAGEGDAHFIILADPYSVALEPFLTGLDYAFPKGAKVGGLASSGASPGENALFFGGQYFRRGLVAVALTGNIAVDPIVAQGCRPIGKPLTIT